MQEAALRRAGPFKPLRTTAAGLSGEFPRDLLLPVHLALGGRPPQPTFSRLIITMLQLVNSDTLGLWAS